MADPGLTSPSRTPLRSPNASLSLSFPFLREGSRIWEDGKQQPLPRDLPSPLPTKRNRTYSAWVRLFTNGVEGRRSTNTRVGGFPFHLIVITLELGKLWWACSHQTRTNNGSEAPLWYQRFIAWCWRTNLMEFKDWLNPVGQEGVDVCRWINRHGAVCHLFASYVYVLRLLAILSPTMMFVVFHPSGFVTYTNHKITATLQQHQWIVKRWVMLCLLCLLLFSSLWLQYGTCYLRSRV